MRSMSVLFVIFCAMALIALQSDSTDAFGQAPTEPAKDGPPPAKDKDGPAPPKKDGPAPPKIGGEIKPAPPKGGGNPPKEPPEEKFDQKKADIETVSTAGLKYDSKSLLGFFQKHTVSDAERARLGALIEQLGDDDFDQRENASEEIEKFGVAAIASLRQAERGSDPEILRRCEICLKHIEKVPTRALAAAAARLLVELKGDNLCETLINYLPMAEDESVADEVRTTLAAAAMKNGAPDPVLNKALESKEGIKRMAAAEAFARGGDMAKRAEMRKLLDDNAADPELKLRVALALVAVAKDKTAVEPLIKSMAEVSPESGWRAEELLIRLAAEKGPSIALGPDKATREKARDEWLKWWQANAKDVDLVKLDETERMLGYTLLIEMDIRGAGGRIMEIGPDGKKRWDITNVQFPTDAIVIPGNRVIVAEQNNNHVSERDIATGKEIWGVNYNQPIGLQRLGNGNLVVVGRHQIVEWDRTRKAVTTITRNSDIVAGAKLRNGQFIVYTQLGQMVTYDKDGKQLSTFAAGRGNYFSSMHVQPNGKILITQFRSIAEVDLNKKDAISLLSFTNPTSAQRLPNGNILVASQNSNQVSEMDPRTGKSVWDFKSIENNNGFYRPWRVKRR